MATTGQTSSKKPKAKKLNKQQIKRRRESRRAAQARYRERCATHSIPLLPPHSYHHLGTVKPYSRQGGSALPAAVLISRRCKPGDEVLEDARAKAREASARYRERNANKVRNREELALQQRQVRKRAYIKKHGLYAHIQRRFDAPIAVPESDSESEGEEDDLSWGPIGYNAMAGPLICDYVDPLLRR
ncbi:hypothetical protein B0H14DRAFT_2559252 [Mycena olivaceomarginata]|nr:hypothetical protein B0H14DRAFT_2559252 [Mycena olivaceomarginata]